ncbi:MAG: tetratricopeptide repeat protein [Pseudomonadota bacterium]
MSTIPPTQEGRRRPVSVLALKLWEVAEALEQRLDNPAEVLEILVTAVAKGEQPVDAWQALHAAAARHDKIAELAFAYEQTASEKRIKLLQPEQQVFVYLRAAEFFAGTLGDIEGAIGHATRAAQAVPGHPEAFSVLEFLLRRAGENSKLAELYVEASAREADPARRSALLHEASELVKTSVGSEELTIEIGQRILRVDPSREDVRSVVVQGLIARGRHKDVVDLLEQALRRDPPPGALEATTLREWLVDLCSSELKDPARVLGHVEGLLATAPDHPMALKSAEALLENRTVSLRAAAALSDAYEKTGRIERAIAMLGVELKQVRGPRRVEVQRRLGILRQDALHDPAGALELLAPVVAGDPGDDDLRRRFVELSLSLNQPEQAARLLARALQTSRVLSVRARVGVDVGHVYLKTGDVKRAQAAFQQVIEAGSDDAAVLEAARHLCELYTEANERKQLIFVLERVVSLEREREPRQAAARRLVRLCDGEGEGGDPARAIVAWRALIGSPWTDEALRRLELLYADASDDEGLSDVLFVCADRSKDPVEARRLAFQAAELRSARNRDPEAALSAWQKLVDRYGPSREIHERMLPLLEQAQRYAELSAVLEREAELLSGAERVQLLVKLGQLRLSRLGDSQGALQALRSALELDPGDRGARAATEKLLAAGEARLAAADVLEPLLRREEPGIGLVRVLETRAEFSTDVSQSLRALDEATTISETSLNDATRALEFAGRALALAAPHEPAQIVDRLAVVNRLASASGDSGRRAELLCAALGAGPLDSPGRLELAKATGEALAAAGDIPRAVETFRRALAQDSSSHELMQRVDELLTEQGAPAERLALYTSTLERETDPTRRREILHRVALLQRRELGDPAAAIAIWRRAVSEEPRDLVLHQSLVETLTECADLDGVYEELQRVLPQLDRERRDVTLLRLAEVATQRHDSVSALTHYRELVQSSDLSDDVLETIEQLAREQDDGKTVRVVLERRLAHTVDAELRANLLERLGNALAWQLDDPINAARTWLEGGRLSASLPDHGVRAQRLFTRVLDADPENREAAEQLVALAARAGDFDAVRAAFEVLLRSSDERELVSLILGIEEPALQTGNGSGFVTLVDLALARGLQSGRARHLQLAKARVLSQDPANADRAAKIFRGLLESSDGDGVADAEAFTAFLARADRSPARVDDRRWLFRFRLEHGSDPAGVLMEWAHLEETLFENVKAARKLYRQVLERDPERTDALSELARLQALSGDAKGALESLESLAARVEPEARAAVGLRRALLMIGSLGRAVEALLLVEPILAANPSDADGLRVVHYALSVPEARARAAAILERVAEGSEDPAARADVIEALLAVSHDAPELAAARSRWLMQLLETKSEAPEEALRLALRGAEAAPAEQQLWAFAEQMARRLDQPGPVAEAYSRAIERELPADVADSLGRNVVEFHEEWFDDPEHVVHLLERVIALCPAAEWAFDRLKLAFNHGGRWPELFALYDRRLSESIPDIERLEILREAAMAARDFANDPERAISYFEKLNGIKPGDGRVESSLERLYERHGHRRPLIELLTVRLRENTDRDPGETMARITALWLDLNEPLPALEWAEKMLAREAGSRDAAALLERIVALPAANSVVLDNGESVRVSAARKLEKQYRVANSTLDVVRMLDVIAQSAPRTERIALLEEVVSLSLDQLGDVVGGFETLLTLVRLEPGLDARRRRFAELAARVNGQQRRAETLVSVAEQEEDAELCAALLAEAADVYRTELGAAPHAMDLYRRVLGLASEAPLTALHAARELSDLLRAAEELLELTAVLEQRAGLEPGLAERLAALGEAAELSLTALADPHRAVRNFQARLALDPLDKSSLDGLCRALESAERWDELVAALGQRARQSEDLRAARADRVRIALLHEQVKGDRTRAIDAWRLVQTHDGRDLESFEALSSLLAAESRFDELAELLCEEVANEQSEQRVRRLHSELGQLHQSRTGNMLAALESFVAADDWSKAIEVAGANHADRELGRRVCQRLLDLAVQGWNRSQGDAQSAEARAADWAVSELTDRLQETGKYRDVVDHLLSAAKLPFTVSRRRGLRRDAACLCSDRLDDAAGAVQLFQELLAEDAGDEVARSLVTRLSLLLDEQGEHEQIVTLWERQASARAAAGDSSGAAALWARAGQLAQERLNDVERAIRCHQAGAALGGEDSLEALSRIYLERKEYEQAALVLEALCAQSSPEVLADRSLELAGAYLATGSPEKARRSLEKAALIAVDAAALRARLATLYREAEDYAALAALLAEEAERATDRKTTLSLLREAAGLHLVQRADPEAAVPLLARAIELEPDDQKQRLQLANALFLANRYEEAAQVLAAQIERYGMRRPKDRALAHFLLARVFLGAKRQDEALQELDAASKIDPAHPGIMQMLARMALEHGQLERAEKMYRSLLLVLGRDDSGDGPSKAEALIALSEISARGGDSVRAGEFLESAFEAALRSPADALALETALRAQQRYDLLARALEARLARELPASDAARALADLVMLHAEGLRDLSQVRDDLARRALSLEAGLEAAASFDDGAWSALGRVYDYLGDGPRGAQVLERRVTWQLQSGRAIADADLLYRLAKARLTDPAGGQQGLELLERALDAAPDFERARTLLTESAGGLDPARVAALLERIARATGDDRVLADALAAQLASPEASLARVREAVAVAVRLGDSALTERMLKAALELDVALAPPGDAAWVRLELAALADAAGRRTEALAYQAQAAEHLPAQEARDLRLSLAQEYAANPQLSEQAVALYELLLDADPSDRSIWQPLLELLRQGGDSTKLIQLISRITPAIEDGAERSALRVEQVNALLAKPGKAGEVILLLQDILADDPSQRDAARVLSDLLEREGRIEDLSALLTSEIDQARDARDVPTIVQLSLRLVGILERKGRAVQALDVCRSALEWDPGRIELLEAVLRLAEATGDSLVIADALEGLLRVAQAETAATLGRRLSALREEQGDSDGAERALMLGFEANPRDSSLRDLLLLRFTEREEYARAAELLSRALRERPDERKLLERLVEAHRAAQDPEAALAVVEDLIRTEPENADFHRKRAVVLADLGRDDESVVAFERAYGTDASVVGELIEAIERAIVRAEPPEEARLTLRLVEVFESSGDLAGARLRLAAFVRANPNDLSALRRLASLEARTGNVEGAIETLAQLVDAERGDALIETALRYSEACELGGRIVDSRGALERALEEDRLHAGLRRRLQAVYEASGAQRELASLLMEDAMNEPDPALRLAALLRAGGLLLGPDGDPAAAVQVLESGRHENPESVEVVLLLARAYAAAGRAEEAIALLSAIAEANRGRRTKGLAGIYGAMAQVHLDEGYLSDALTALSKAFELDPKNGELAMRLGQLAVEIDEDELAQKVFRAVSIMKPPAPGSTDGASTEAKADANYYLAVLAKKAGDSRKAKVLVAKALAEKADHVGARQLLAELGTERA